MALIDKILNWVADNPAVHADRALGAALELAEPEYFERLVDMLLQRRTAASWAALIGVYEKLPTDVCRKLLADENLMLDGASLAMKSTSPAARHHALAAIAQFPAPNLAHLCTLALREKSQATRERAVATLRLMSETFLKSGEIRAGQGAEARLTPERQRAQLGEALRDALRSIDLHLQVTVLEPCLWFDDDLAGDLNDALNKPRSRCIHVLEENLAQWDTPLLAGFLLRSLTRPELRRLAQSILRDWNGRDHIVELLKRTPMLSTVEVRNSLVLARSPLWFSGENSTLRQIPVHLRPFAPTWVTHAGFTEAEKTALLSRWARQQDLATQQTAVWALATIDSEEAESVLKQISDSMSPVSTAARAAMVERESRVAQNVVMSSTDAAANETSAAFEGDREFASFWQRLRRAGTAELDKSVATVIQRADRWTERLLACLRSPDAKDRMLAARLIQRAGHARQYLAALKPLVDDANESVRRVVTLMLASPDAPPPAAGAISPPSTAARGAPPAVAPPPTAAGPSPREEAQERAAKEARELFGKLMEAGHLDDKRFFMMLERLQTLVIELRRDAERGTRPPAAREASPNAVR